LFYRELKAFPAFYAKDPERAKTFLPIMCAMMRYFGIGPSLQLGEEDRTNLNALKLPTSLSPAESMPSPDAAKSPTPRDPERNRKRSAKVETNNKRREIMNAPHRPSVRQSQAGKRHGQPGNGALENTPYSFSSRFENGAGTNPKNSLPPPMRAASPWPLRRRLARRSHAGKALDRSNVDPRNKFKVLDHHHDSLAVDPVAFPDISQAKFAEIAADAKANCPVSRLLKAEITLDTKLEG